MYNETKLAPSTSQFIGVCVQDNSFFLYCRHVESIECKCVNCAI